jgi:hypothetical protein
LETVAAFIAGRYAETLQPSARRRMINEVIRAVRRGLAEAGMEPSDIERIKRTHKPRPRWLNCRIVTGCACGAKRWPCDAILAARDAEGRANQIEVERWQRFVLNRQYGRQVPDRRPSRNDQLR